MNVGRFKIMTYETIVVSSKDGVYTIQLNRPEKKNAMTLTMMSEITLALTHAAALDEVIVAVITGGTSNYYSSGFDLSSSGFISANMELEKAIEKASAIGRKFVDTLIDFNKVLVAVVNGPAIGLAVTTLALCDIVYASENATFMVPFSSLGLTAEGCSSYLFPRIMGPARAGEFLYTNKKFSSYEAKEVGLVSDVFSSKDFNSKVQNKLKEITNKSAESLLSIKKLIKQYQSELLHQVNHKEWDELEVRFTSEDVLNSFLKFIQRSKL